MAVSRLLIARIASDATHHPSVVLVAAVASAWDDDVATDQVQVVGAVTIAPRSGPIDPVGITAADRRTKHVPGIGKVIWI